MKIAVLVSLLFLGSFFSGYSQDDWMEPGEQQPVQSLSFDGREFTNAFNAAADRPRLVTVFSPT